MLTLNAVEMPAVQQLVTNSTQIAASVERFARVAEQLPGQVSTEREEILKALQSQEKADAAGQECARRSGGSQMSASLNTTLTTFDALMKRFGVGETNNAGPPATNAEPFRIQDYTQTAAQLEATARQLTELLVTLDQTLGSTNLAKLTAQVGPVVQQAQTGGERNRGLCLLERHPPGAHRARGRLDLPLSCHPANLQLQTKFALTKPFNLLWPTRHWPPITSHCFLFTTFLLALGPICTNAGRWQSSLYTTQTRHLIAVGMADRRGECCAARNGGSWARIVG